MRSERAEVSPFAATKGIVDLGADDCLTKPFAIAHRCSNRSYPMAFDKQGRDCLCLVRTKASSYGVVGGVQRSMSAVDPRVPEAAVRRRRPPIQCLVASTVLTHSMVRWYAHGVFRRGATRTAA
jgi:hypothetical protein